MRVRFSIDGRDSDARVSWMRPLRVGLLVLAAVMSCGCGSRTSLAFLEANEQVPDPGVDAGLEVRPPSDGGVDSGIEATFDAGPPKPDSSLSKPDAETPTPDGGNVAPNDAESTTPSLAPHCVASSTCATEYIPVGYGWAAGSFSIETISVACHSPPTIVQQLVGGSWVSLAPFVANAADTANPGSDEYDVADPSGHETRDPQPGAPVGTALPIRACVYTSTGDVACDPASIVTVTNCSTCAVNYCPYGRFLDSNCNCVADFCPCPRDTWPACPTPVWQCWGGG
jgi:hypothetical protein